VEYSG
jgi:hypothetical protein